MANEQHSPQTQLDGAYVGGNEVVIKGDLSVEAARNAYNRTMDAVCAEVSSQDYVFDFRQLDYMGSTEFSSLIKVHTLMDRDNAERRLRIRPGKAILRLITLTSLEDIFDILPDEPSDLQNNKNGVK